MKTPTLAYLCGALAAVAPVAASAQAATLTPHDSALHVLNRLAYGPRPGEADRVAADGVLRWIDRQLSPGKIDDGPLAARERRVQIPATAPAARAAGAPAAAPDAGRGELPHG